MSQPTKSMILRGAFVLAVPVAIASAACYKAGPNSSCCSSAQSFDGTGNCSPWAHSCPDQAISDPAIRTVVEAAPDLGDNGAKIQTQLTCQFQPKKCKFIGCENDGPVATAGCFDEILNNKVACTQPIPQ